MEKERAKLLDELLNQIDRAYDLMEEYDSMSRKYGEVILYQVEAHLIKYIGEHPGTTVSDIAQDLNKTSSAASQMVKKLQTKGLIEQIKNEKNRRNTFLNLTSAGWSLYEAREKFEQHCYERTFEYLAEFSEKEIEVVCRILDRMNQIRYRGQQNVKHAQKCMFYFVYLRYLHMQRKMILSYHKNY